MYVFHVRQGIKSHLGYLLLRKCILMSVSPELQQLSNPGAWRQVLIQTLTTSFLNSHIIYPTNSTVVIQDISLNKAKYLCTSRQEFDARFKQECLSLSLPKVHKASYPKSINQELLILGWRGLGDSSGVYRVLAGKRERKGLLERPRREWVDNIKMDIQNIVWKGMDWSDLAQDRKSSLAVVNAVTNLPLG